MRCSVMFIRVKASSTEEGIITFTQAPLRTLLCYSSEPHMRTGADCAAQVNAYVGFIPARFWTVPEATLQGIYTVICHQGRV